MDWKDALSQLQNDTPELQASAEEAADTPVTDSDPLTHAINSQRGRLVIEMERKGRGGKTATIISGFTTDDDAVGLVAAHLKKSLGTGGSSRGGEILIQGDRREAIRDTLRRMGFKTN